MNNYSDNTDKTYYEILGVHPKATNLEINTAYRKLAKKNHPDKGGDGEVFKQINRAKETLLEPSKRKAYDSFLSQKVNEINVFLKHWHEVHLHELKNSISSKTWDKYQRDKGFEPEGMGDLLHPIRRVVEDFKTTFNAYKKSSYYVKRDFLQPLEGLKNIVIAPFIALTGILIMTVGSLINFFKPTTDLTDKPTRSPHYHLSAGILLLSTSLLYLGSGILQIATTPLVWFGRIPIRALISLKKGRKKIEDNTGIMRVLDECHTALKNKDLHALYLTTSVLHAKFLTAHKKNQQTGINHEEELRCFTTINTTILKLMKDELPIERSEKITSYFNIFKKKSDPNYRHAEPKPPAPA